MGYYINSFRNKPLPAKNKWLALRNAGCAIVRKPIQFQPDLVCVVTNPAYDAAAYIYSEEEMNIFLEDDGRPKTWFIVPDADKLSGF